MKAEKLREIEEILTRLREKEDELNEWEAKFVNDTLERFERGTAKFVSPLPKPLGCEHITRCPPTPYRLGQS